MIKKIFLATVSSLLLYAGYSQSFYDQPEMKTNQEFTDAGYRKLKVVIRHHGIRICECPGCLIPWCPCPLGICISRASVVETDYDLTEEDVKNEFGTLWVKIADGQIHLVFNNRFSDEEGNIPIDDGLEFSSKTIEGYDLETVVLKGGNYPLVFSRYHYGELVLDIKN